MNYVCPRCGSNSIEETEDDIGAPCLMCIDCNCSWLLKRDDQEYVPKRILIDVLDMACRCAGSPTMCKFCVMKGRVLGGESVDDVIEDYR